MRDKPAFKFNLNIVRVLMSGSFVLFAFLAGLNDSGASSYDDFMGALPKAIGHPLVLLLIVAPDFRAILLTGGILGIVLGLTWPLLASAVLRLGKKLRLPCGARKLFGLANWRVKT